MTKVKICGLKRNEDIEYVNKLCPDYVGFVFAKSSRSVDINKAKELIRALKKEIKTVGVFLNEDIKNVRQIGETLELNVLQLHGDEDGEYINKLNDFQVWKAVSISSENIDNSYEKITRELVKKLDRLNSYNLNGIVLDSCIKGAKGGTGISFNWNILNDVKIDKPLILAGGLNENNVQEAIDKVLPYAVDVSTGVETNGVKDFEKMRQFIKNVRKNDVKREEIK